MEKLVHEILSSTPSLQESNTEEINKKFFENLEKRISVEVFNAHLLNCGKKSHLERILMINGYFEWIPIAPEVTSKYAKHPGLSSQLREKANDFFRAKNYIGAFQCYNLAIMFSPSNNEALGLAFANRSATLLAMGKPLEAVKDIDLALAHNYPEKLRKKLDERKKTCHEIMKPSQEEEEEAARKLMCATERDKRKRFCDGILFRLKKPNTLISSAEDFVQVRFDPTRGRQLIVNRDIPAGTVLIVEKPFISVLKDSIKWDVSHCHFCLRRIIGGVPCPGCVFAIYCDESCQQKARDEFHAFECPCMPYLHINSAPRYVLLALRIVCKLGPKKLQTLFNENLESLSFPLDRYDSDSYKPIYNFVSHPTQMEPIDLYTNALNALILTKTLDTQSKFFEGTEEGRKSDFFNFVASIILRHVDNIPCNSMSIDEVEGLENVTLYDTLYSMSKDDLAATIRSVQFPQIAAGAYGVASLMNHSCDPNVTRVNGLSDGALAVVATRSLKCNEEILNCYSRSFTSDSVGIRRTCLSEKYFFDCACIACKNNWPGLSVLMKSQAVFCCQKCSGGFAHDEKESKKFKKCVLQGLLLECKLCRKQYSIMELEEELNRSVTKFFIAYHSVLVNAPLEAIRTLMPILKFFQTSVRPPYHKSSMGQDVYKQALELIVYFSK